MNTAETSVTVTARVVGETSMPVVATNTPTSTQPVMWQMVLDFINNVTQFFF